MATCGTELDRLDIDHDDFLLQFWLDEIKENLLYSAHAYLKEYIHRQYPFLKTTSMSPGSGDINVWRIEDQKPLFEILGDVQNAIGVTLTDSMLMKPNKSLSGIRYPAEKDFRTCQLCHRKKCPARQSPLDENMVKCYK